MQYRRMAASSRVVVALGLQLLLRDWKLPMDVTLVRVFDTQENDTPILVAIALRGNPSPRRIAIWALFSLERSVLPIVLM